MEIVGVGTEIVECLRIGRMVEQHGEAFLNRVFTGHEIQFCQARKRATEHFAACWAAKETVVKALGIAWSRSLSWTDIEIHTGVPAGTRSAWSAQCAGWPRERGWGECCCPHRIAGRTPRRTPWRCGREGE